MASITIYMHKPQTRKAKFLSIISKAVNADDVVHRKFYSSATVKEDGSMILFYANGIKILYSSEINHAVLNKIKEALTKQLNAEKFCVIVDGEVEWVRLERYKPKFFNKIRYKLSEI